MTTHATHTEGTPQHTPARRETPRPRFRRGDTPRYYLHDGQALIEADELCRECGGEGFVQVEIPRGTWSTAQGGMWVQDFRQRKCAECHGTSYVSRERCAACGMLSHECECDRSDDAEHLMNIAAIEEIAARVAEVHAVASEHGLNFPANLHGVTWNDALALAAKHGGRLDVHVLAPRYVVVTLTTPHGMVDVFGSVPPPEELEE